MEDMNLLTLAPPEPPPRPHLRTLGPRVETVSRGHRLLAGVLAVLIAVGYCYFVLQYAAAAHPGVDQNGYLVGGKMLARTGSTGYQPADPLGFVGAMWVRYDPTWTNYPKYPVGLPLLYAVVFWTCGHAATTTAFLVSPVCTGLAVLGTYLLTRQFAGPFASLLSMLLLGFGQVTLVLADNPNSHASCLAFGIWGVFLLVRFWETGSVWRGLLAGFLIGFAATIRYTDGLLGLLIGFVVLSALVYRNWRGWWRAFTPVIGWLVPVGYLVLFNLVAMHSLTGYDTTNESNSFTLDNLTQNWEKAIRQIHDRGLFFTLPLGVLGMVLAYRAGPRRATLLWLWLVPGTLTYMAYYWAPERGVSYLRFFLTLLPPLVVGAAVLFDQILVTSHTRRGHAVAAFGCGLIVFGACSISLYRSLFGLEDGQETGLGMEAQFREDVNLAGLAQVVTRTAPAGSTLIATTDILHDLQFAGDYACYSTETFTTGFALRLEHHAERTDPNDPDPQQAARCDFLLKQLKDRSSSQLDDLEAHVVQRSIAQGRRVFLVVLRGQTFPFMRRYDAKASTLTWSVRGSYNDLPRLKVPDDTAAAPPTDPQQRFINQMGPRRNGQGAGNSGGRPRGGPNAGGPRPGAMAWRDWQPRAWQVIEIYPKPAHKSA